MKSIFTVLFIVAASFTAFSQTQGSATSSSQTTKSATTITTYRCPECGFKSQKPGICPVEKTTLVKVGDYYCPDCYMSQAKAGKCSMCGVDMKQMTMVSKTK